MTYTKKTVRQDGRTEKDGVFHQYGWGDTVHRSSTKDVNLEDRQY